MNSRNGFLNVGRVHVCLLALIVGAIALFTPMAQAFQTSVWTYAGGGLFTNNSNWGYVGAGTSRAPTNHDDTANITNKTAGYSITNNLTFTNNLLVVSNATLVITNAVMTVTNTQVTANNTQNNGLSDAALTLWNGGNLEIDNGGTLNVTASTTNNDIYWVNPNCLAVLNSGGMLSITGQLNCYICNGTFWTNHITSTTGSGGAPGSGGILNYGGNRSLYAGRNLSNSTLIIDNGVTVSNITSLYLGNAGTNATMWITNGATVWLNPVVTNGLNGAIGTHSYLYIGAGLGALNNGVVVSNASFYGDFISIGNGSSTIASNNYLIATAGSSISNSGNIAIGATTPGCVSNYMILNNSTLLNSGASSAFTISTTVGANNYAIFTNGSFATLTSLSIGNSTTNNTTTGTNNYLIVDHSTLNLISSSTTFILGNGAAANDYAVINCSTVNMTGAYGIVDIGGTNNTLSLTGGSVLSNAEIFIGYVASNCNDSLTFNSSTNIGVGANNLIYVGYASGTNNYLIVTNGSSVTAYELTVGNVGGSTNCYATFDHSTLNLSNTTALVIGTGSSMNNYVIMNSATANMIGAYGIVETSGSNSTLSVTGGSLITNAMLYIGFSAGNCNNGVILSSSTFDGSLNGTHGAVDVGHNAGTNNYLLVTNNSAMTAYTLTVGNVAGSTNCYAIFSNATLTTTIGGNALILGAAAGGTSNSLTFYNSTIYATNGNGVGGGIAINDVSGSNGGTNNVMTFNNSTAYLGSSIILGNDFSPAMPWPPTLNGNGLVITNGSYVGYTNGGSCSVTMGGNGNYIVVAGTNSAGQQSILDLGSGGSGAITLGSPCIGCSIRVDAGGVISNLCGKSGLGYCLVSANVSASLNATLIITNGGRVIGGPVSGVADGWNIGGGGNALAGGIGAGMIVSGPGSVFDWSTNEYVSANSCLNVPNKSGFGTNGYLIVNNGGLVKLDLNANALVYVGGQANALTNSVSNTVTIASGGTLEAPGYQATNAIAGNTITNNGGIYQFASPVNAPILTTVSGGSTGIFLNSGTISYRSTSNADVHVNQPGKPLDSTAKMAFLGNNIFRLNWATNQVQGGSQCYVFDPGKGATNFYRLEMVTAGTPGTIPTTGGSTCYRGTNGDSLTIGQSVGSGGQMLCSNTAAKVSLIFTNNGTLSIENSTLALGANAVMNGALVVDMNNLTPSQVAGSAAVLTVTSNLTITGSSTLVLNGTPTNLTLVATTGGGTVSGRFGSATYPLGYALQYGTTSISLYQVAVPTALFFW